MRLPDELVEAVRIATDDENDAKMRTVFAVGGEWNKYKEAIIYNYADEEGLEQLDEGKARAWFLKSLAGNLANISYPTLANRMRVFRNVVDRGLYEGNEIITAPTWVYLLRNLPAKDDLVDIDQLKERIEWYHAEDMPTTRTIEEHVRKNGYHQEWEQLWRIISKNIIKLNALDKPNWLRQIIDDWIYKVEEDA